MKETFLFPTCKSHGINEKFINCCRQIGAKAMSCECTDDYVGRNCEVRLLDSVDGGRNYFWNCYEYEIL